MNANAGWTAREYHAAVTLSDGSVLVMDGEDDSGNCLNDTWRSTDEGATWDQIADAEWSARDSSAAVALPDGSVIVMGRYDDVDNYLNDFWRFQPAGSNEQDPTHTYTTAGNYQVTLQAYNNGGATQVTGIITVSSTPTKGVNTSSESAAGTVTPTQTGTTSPSTAAFPIVAIVVVVVVVLVLAAGMYLLWRR